MEEILDIFSLIFQTLRAEISEYFEKCNSYLKEFFVDKGIDLNTVTTYETDEKIHDTVEKIVRVINVILKTFGISKKRLKEENAELEEIINKRGENYPDYNSYYINDLRNYFNSFLFEILIEYLIDLDETKVENLELYRLIPQFFILKMNLFKKENIDFKTKSLVREKISYIRKYIDFTNLKLITVDELKADNELEAIILDELEADNDLGVIILDELEPEEMKEYIMSSTEISEVTKEQKIDKSMKPIIVICPICKDKGKINIPESIIDQARQLTTVLIPKDLICNHFIQVFVDKQFKVRGYQKIDYEIE